MAAKSILIKKYENRRLYDATNSRYVNLEEVAQLVQQGHDVQVIDAATGEDITRVILTQIIAEGAKTPESRFPLDILRQMVIASGRASQESAIRYTKAMLDLYQSTYRAMSPALNPFSFMGPGGESEAEKRGESTPSPADSGSPSNQDVDQLKARVAELEKIVSSLPPTKTAKARRKATTRKAASSGSTSKRR